MKRLAGIGASLSTCAASLILGSLAGPAAAAPSERCTAHTGTIVAVDFSHWGGPIVRGCALHEKTDYDLLHAAGFTTAGDQHDGPGFICRLGDKVFDHGAPYPTVTQQDCILTPPASAYWSDWLAPAGADHWDYSQLGAMSEVPKPGEVELWTFGGTDIAGTHGSGVPRVRPDTLRADAAASITNTGPAVVDAQPTIQHASSGSAAAAAIGIAIAALLCGGAGWTVWRRRRCQ